MVVIDAEAASEVDDSNVLQNVAMFGDCRFQSAQQRLIDGDVLDRAADMAVESDDLDVLFRG